MEPIDNPVETELADLLESYPASTTTSFQTIISSKKEFAELKLEPMERLNPGRGKFYKHQKFTHRYLRAYDSLVITSQPGSGKSCESLGFIELAFAERDKALKDPTKGDEKLSHLKKAIILVKGPTQKSEVRNQLVCKCSNGHFETIAVRKARNEVSQKSAVTAEIKDAGYTIMTYTTFARNILRKYPEDDQGVNDKLISDEYSDTIFWIDEAHNLLVDAFTGSELREKQQTYQTIWRVLHLAKRSKKILSTATPMINDTREIGYLMNLILPINGSIPLDYDYRNASANDIRVLFPNLPRSIDHRNASRDTMAKYYVGQIPSNYDFNNANLEDLEPLFRGRIGFVRASDTGTVTTNKGVAQEEIISVDGVEYKSNSIIYTSQMSDFQSEAYERASYNGGRKDDLRGSERQAGNFVFPDGQWGNGISEAERARHRKNVSNVIDDDDIDIQIMEEEDGNINRHAFRRYVIVNNDTYTPTEEFAPYLKNIDFINNLSRKFGSIVSIVKNEPGNAFVYGEYVEGSGAIVLGLCFEGMGFQRYNETTSMFVGSDVDTIKPYCGGGTSTNKRQINPNFKKALRYVLLTRKTTDTKFQSMMELFNSYENRHGEYIKVLIASRVGRDGINVNNGRQVHLVGSEWNQSAMYQALSRVFRATSHEDLLKEERKRLEDEGLDPADARVNVNVYKHAAVTNDGQSVDVEMYLLSEFKDRAISRIMRMLKQCSIGCQTHYARNVRDTDVDYSAECDYDICKYACVDPQPRVIDYSTYDVLYATELVETLTDEILNIFRQYNSLDINTLCDILDTNRKYVIMALEYLIINKYPIIDRFGYKTYLREDHGYFYLDKVYPVGVNSSYPMAYYTNGLIAIETNPLASIVNDLQAETTNEVIDNLANLDPESEEFTETINSLSIEGQTLVLEQAAVSYVNNVNVEHAEKIMDMYRGILFAIHEPVTELRSAMMAIANKVTKRGRKPLQKNAGKPLRDISHFKRETDTEIVYVHTMDSLSIQSTKYNATARYNKAEGKIRLFKPSENVGWRDVNTTEYRIYNAYIRLEIIEKKLAFEAENPIYGTVINGVFRIVDKLHEKQTANADSREKNRGRTCTEMELMRIVDMCYNVDMPFPTQYKRLNRTESHRKAIIDVLEHSSLKTWYSRADLTKWSTAKLFYYIDLSNLRILRNDLCHLLYLHLQATNRIME